MKTNKATQFIAQEIVEKSNNLSLAIKRSNKELINDFNQTLKKIERENNLSNKVELLSKLQMMIMAKLMSDDKIR